MDVTILSYEDLYGWTMDKVFIDLCRLMFLESLQVVAKIGKKNNCTYCGVFRRQALDRGAQRLRVDKLVHSIPTVTTGLL